MYKTILATLACALCATSTYAGFGDFLKKATETATTVTNAVSGSTSDSAEQEAIAKQLGTACANFATAKSKAYAAIGNTAESNKYATLSETLTSEKNLETLANFVDGEKTTSTLSLLQNVEVKGDDQKALIAESVKAFASGVQEEVELGKELATAAKTASEAIQSASGADKVAVVANLTPLLNLSKRFPADIQNAKETLKGYIDFAKKNGIDVSSIATSFLK